AAALIDDSEKPDALLTNNSRGIAWWGDKDSDDVYANTFPIDDAREIEEMLDVFGLKRYNDQETGTTIIIPFINEEKIYSHDETHDDFQPIKRKKNKRKERIEHRIKKGV